MHQIIQAGTHPAHHIQMFHDPVFIAESQAGIPFLRFIV